MNNSVQAARRAVGRLRYSVLALLFIATTVNYADRATLSIAGAQMQSQLGLSIVTMGYLFSAFGWSYVAAQIPGGWLLDRFGSRRVYSLSILFWAALGLAQGAAGHLRLIGGVLGGVLSDALLGRGYSLTVARKLPIIGGLLLSTVMIACNYVYTDWLVVLIMSLAFFGKGIGALGWAVVADTSPPRMAGLSGALFNTFGNTAAITTPIIIGYIVAATGTFAGALAFVVANALVAILSYLLVVGPIVRLDLEDCRPDLPLRCARD